MLSINEAALLGTKFNNNIVNNPGDEILGLTTAIEYDSSNSDRYSSSNPTTTTTDLTVPVESSTPLSWLWLIDILTATTPDWNRNTSLVEKLQGPVSIMYIYNLIFFTGLLDIVGLIFS